MIRRAQLLAMLPLILLDCIGSVCIGESFMRTISAKAHDARAKGHKHWSGCAAFIDGMFFWQDQHCLRQWEREEHHGSVWAAWAADWAAAVPRKGVT